MNSLVYTFARKHVVLLNIYILFSILCLTSCSEKQAPSTTTQRSYLTPEVLCGTVQFSDGCSPKLDTLISFGIALIHHMTYEDAEYTFNKVIETDKDCFWGYWGKAMTYVHPLWPDIPDKEVLNDGFVLSQNALKLAKTQKEKAYGAAIAAYFDNGVNKTEPERLIAFNQGWKLASKEMPDDVEAKLFSVLSMLAVASPDDKTYKIQKEAGAISENLMKTYTDHPGAFHYALHAYDYPPLALNALRVARNYYKIAPEIPHALHMPTHIFTRLGYWQESIDLNLRSAASAKKIPVKGQTSAQYFHALDYLVYAYLQKAEFKKAENSGALLTNLNGSYEPSPISAYALAAIPGRIAIESHDWTKASNLSIDHYPNFPWHKFPQYEALVYFAKGIGAGRSGNVIITKDALQKLEELQSTFKKSEANQYWINQIEIQITAIEAWLLFAQNENEKAIQTMKKAADLEDVTEKNPVTPGSILPAREMLADLLLELKNPKEALKQYEMSLKNCPNRFNSLFGAGKSAQLLGDKKKASFYFSTLLNNTEEANPEIDRVAYARSASDL